jgi:hypothetical protein
MVEVIAELAVPLTSDAGGVIIELAMRAKGSATSRTGATRRTR